MPSDRDRCAALHPRRSTEHCGDKLGDPAALPAVQPRGCGNGRRRSTTHVADNDHALRLEQQADGPVRGRSRRRSSLRRARGGRGDTRGASDHEPTAALMGARQNGVAGEAPSLYDVASTSNSKFIHIVPIRCWRSACCSRSCSGASSRRCILIVSVHAQLPRRARGVGAHLHRHRRLRRDHVHPAVPHVPLPPRSARLRHPRHDTHPGRRRHDLPLRDAVIQALGRTGSTITSAGLVLAETFAVLAVHGRGAARVAIRSSPSVSASRSGSSWTPSSCERSSYRQRSSSSGERTGRPRLGRRQIRQHRSRRASAENGGHPHLTHGLSGAGRRANGKSGDPPGESRLGVAQPGCSRRRSRGYPSLRHRLGRRDRRSEAGVRRLDPDAGPRHYPVTRPGPDRSRTDGAGNVGYDSEDLQFWEVVCVPCGDTDGPAIRQSAEVQMLRGPYPSERRANRAANDATRRSPES